MKVRRTIRQCVDKLSIRKKLIWSTGLVTIIPVIFLFGIIIFRFMHTNLDNTRRQAQIALDKATGELEAWYTQIDGKVSALVFDLNVQREIQTYINGPYREKQEAREFLYNQLMNFYTLDMGVLNASFYLDAEQTILSGDHYNIDLYGAYGEEEWFQDLLNGQRSFYMGTGQSLTIPAVFYQGQYQKQGKEVLIMATAIISIQTRKELGIFYVELG